MTSETKEKTKTAPAPKFVIVGRPPYTDWTPQSLAKQLQKWGFDVGTLEATGSEVKKPECLTDIVGESIPIILGAVPEDPDPDSAQSKLFEKLDDLILRSLAWGSYPKLIVVHPGGGHKYVPRHYGWNYPTYSMESGLLEFGLREIIKE